MRTLNLPAGEPIPALGQGTWHMAEDRSRRKLELEALRLGIELGMTLIDTAEMHDGLGAIPKAGTPSHVRLDHAALVLHLTRSDLEMLDRAFEPRNEKVPLEML